MQNNEVLKNSFDQLKKNQGRLHFLGLLSDGGVHSHYDHFESFLQIAKDNAIKNTFIHAFLDGRDTPPKSAAKYLNKLDAWISSNSPPLYRRAEPEISFMNRLLSLLYLERS